MASTIKLGAIIIPPGSIYVSGFGKACIVHTSDFSHLKIHKNHSEWYTNLKLSRVIKE